MCGRTRWSCKGLCSVHKVTCRCCAQLRDPLKILVRKSTAGRFLSLSPRRRLWPTSCADTRTQFNSTSPSTPTPRCSSSHIPTPLIKRRTTTIWWVVWMIHESIQQQWKTYSTVVSKPLWTHIVHKLEMVQEAAQRIKRYYRNTYTYGPGAATLCKTAFFLFFLFLKQSHCNLNVWVFLLFLQTHALAALTTGRTNLASNTPLRLSSRTAGNTASCYHLLTYPGPATKRCSRSRPLLSRFWRKHKLRQTITRSKQFCDCN